MRVTVVNDVLTHDRRRHMLWLIWIAIMLLVPMLAGVHVWFEIHQQPVETPAAPRSVPSDSHS